MKIYRGRTEPCKDNLGGISKVYLFNYCYTNADQATGKRGVSLTSYPATIVFEFEVRDAAFNENRAEELGDWSQSLDFTIFKQSATDALDIELLMDNELGVIIKGRDGIFRLLGAENGMRLETAAASTGGGHSDLNGYRLSFVGSERFKAPLFTDLNGVGFGIDSGENYLLSEIFEILTDGTDSLIYA